MTGRPPSSSELPPHEPGEAMDGVVDSFDALLEAAVRPSEGSDERELLPSRFLRLAIGTQISQRFTVRWYAGAGGMGDVYRCLDAESGRDVAVKVIRKVCDQGRFRREASILAALRHEAIVRYIAHGATDAGTPYLAMEWLEGEDLGKQLRRSRLSVAHCVALSRRICSGLGLAHGLGFVHRDIKPSNVFLAHGRMEEAKLLDFGIAHGAASTQTATRAGTVLGTVGYMAPDQASGMGLPDARDDLFSLGCVIFECLTGRPAFAGESAVAVLDAVLHAEPPSVASIRSDVPHELDDLVTRLLRKPRQERPTSAFEVIRLLDQLQVAAPLEGGRERPHLSTRFVVVVSTHARHASGPDLDLRDVATRFDGSLPAGQQPARVISFRTSADLSVLDAVEQALACAGELRALRPDQELSVECVRQDYAAPGRDGELGCAHPIRTCDERPGIVLNPLAAQLHAARARLDDDRGKRTCPPDGPGALEGEGLPFVGRHKELDVLTAVYRECIDDAITRSLLVIAPSGLGKTRLAREFLARVASPGGCRILTVRANRSERASAMSLARRLAFQLATPAMSSSTEDVLSFADGLRSACASCPVLVCIDDAHWVDLESMKWLETSIRNLMEGPLLLLGLTRATITPELRAVWRATGAHELNLRPLHDRAAERLLASQVTEPAEGSALVRLARGNPRLLTTLAAAQVTGAEADAESAVAMIVERLDALTEAELSALRAASVLGATFDRAAMSAVLGSESQLDRPLEVLCTEHLLAATTRADGKLQYSFAHRAVRDAALCAFAAKDRAEAQQRAARWLANEQLTVRPAAPLAP